MYFVLPAHVIDDSPATLDAMDLLLARVIYEVHVVLVPDGDLVEQTHWFLGLPSHRRDFVRKMIYASAFHSSHKTNQTRVIVIGDTLDLLAAARLAYVPLTILVEDKFSDGLLLEAAIQAFGSDNLLRLWRSTL